MRFAVDMGIVDPKTRQRKWKEMGIYETRILAEIVIHGNRRKHEVRLREIPANAEAIHPESKP